MFYSYFAALGLDITLEDSTSHGNVWTWPVRFGGNVYLFEFKVVDVLEPEGAALAQLREQGLRDEVSGRGRG